MRREVAKALRRPAHGWIGVPQQGSIHFCYTWIGTLGVGLALAWGSALATSFRLTDLGTLGGTSSEGVALNASGQATGFSTTAGGETNAFLWDGTTLQDLRTLGARLVGART